jgi:hypothetical protein
MSLGSLFDRIQDCVYVLQLALFPERFDAQSGFVGYCFVCREFLNESRDDSLFDGHCVTSEINNSGLIAGFFRS